MPLDELIIGILTAGGGMYGLELVRKSGGRLSAGAAYITLQRMEAKGLLRRATRADGLQRYRATAAGKRFAESQRAARSALKAGRALVTRKSSKSAKARKN